MKCPNCKKEVKYIEEVQYGRATITYRRDRAGNMTHEEIDDFEDVESYGMYCPHCSKSLDGDFIAKFLRED